MVNLVTTWSLLLIAFSLAACDKSPSASTSGENSAQVAKSIKAPTRKKDFATFMQAGKLYRKNCAQCHGDVAQGDPNWRQRDAKGKLPAPPLNGTGHAWHHSTQVLAKTIRDGTLHIGGSMPPWRNTLNDKEINMIIEWFQSRWSDEIYKAWLSRNG